MKVIGRAHKSLVFGRRVNVLAGHLASALPHGANVLDIGCGDGSIAQCVSTMRPDIHIQGIDVLVRENTRIPVTAFDGLHVPFGDANFDVVIFIDVLHHTYDQVTLLREAIRVSRKYVLIKDHVISGFFAETTLRFMDWVGNAHHGVSLPYNYCTQDEWDRQINLLGLQVNLMQSSLGLYPLPASIIFDRKLHFMGLYQKPSCPE